MYLDEDAVGKVFVLDIAELEDIHGLDKALVPCSEVSLADKSHLRVWWYTE